jgi:hypothetical protein
LLAFPLPKILAVKNGLLHYAAFGQHVEFRQPVFPHKCQHAVVIFRSKELNANNMNFSEPDADEFEWFVVKKHPHFFTE